ncbi:MAG TPA: hypothetical protein PK323_03365 [Bacteroidia bacterium]|nr:hypothetical protein [Bacteroidia bacterium]
MKKRVYLIIYVLIASYGITLSDNGTITINATYTNHILQLNSSTQSLSKCKKQNITVNLLSDTAIINMDFKITFITKKNEIPDILKAFIPMPNGTLGLLNKSKQHVYSKMVSDIEIKGDFTEIEVIVKINATQEVKKNIELGNRNYVKPFNFTSGLFYNNLVNPEFSVSADGTNIINEGRKKHDIAFGALINTNYVICPSFKMGISTGVALSLFEAKQRFMFGGNITFGKKNEFCFSAGLAFAKLTRLSNTISTDGETIDPAKTSKNAPITETVIVTNNLNQNTISSNNTTTKTSEPYIYKTVPKYDEWKRGFYVSLTYSLIKK